MRKLSDIRHLATGLALGLGLLAGTALAQPRELVIAQAIDTPGFDPHAHSTGAVEAIHVNIFDYLIRRTPEGNFEPALAETWEQIGDRAMKFTLRPGVKFHDGSPLTAQDVKFSIERPALNKDIYVHAFYQTIREIEVLNDLEFIVHTSAPDPILLNRLTFNGAGIVSKDYVERVGWEEFTLKPIGTGPFKVVEWRRDDRVIMEAFDDHWRGRAPWDRLVHRTIPEASTRVGELINGGVHIATNIPAQDVTRLSQSGMAKPLPWPGLRIMELFLNMQPGAKLADPRLREAVELAIDNRGLIDAAMGGQGTPVRSSVVPGISSAPMKYYDTFLYDPARAVQLLAEAGFGPGELSLKIQGPAGRYPNDVAVMEVIAVMLEAVGIKVEIEAMEWSAFQSRIWLPAEVTDIALIGHANSLGDGYYALQRARCGDEYAKITGWCDATFDQLVNAAAESMDPPARTEMIYQAFERMTDSRSILFLFQLDNIIGVSSAVDWTPTPDERLWMFAAHPAP